MIWHRTVTNGLARYRSGGFVIYEGRRVVTGRYGRQSVQRYWYVRYRDRPIGTDYRRLKDAKADADLYGRTVKA